MTRLELADIMLADEPGFRRVTVAAVINSCARHYGIAKGLLTEPDGGQGQRERWIARKRQLAMFLARELTDASYPQIGHAFGHRDHTTVLHACKQVRKRAEEGDKYTKADLRAVMNSLGAIELP